MERIVILVGIRRNRVIQASTIVLGVILPGHHRTVDAIHRRRTQRLELLIRQIDRVIEREGIVENPRPAETEAQRA